ncbi:MAG: hypothetical protein BGO77_03235 [Caedibacter sp. 37-49]|nr:MAG: hypothetical protein BGO77_03235 [Caedibacter sp. 37-49]
MTPLNMIKSKRQKTVLMSLAALMLTSSLGLASRNLSEEDQIMLINAQHLHASVEGKNIKAGIIDGFFDPHSDTQAVLSHVTKDAYQGQNPRQVVYNAQNYGHDHANHVASSIHNMAPRTELRVIDVNNDPSVLHAGQGNARLIAALDEAIRAKLDFVNISLRIAPDRDWNGAISQDVKAAFLRARDAGVGIIKSAGNDQEFTGTSAYTLSLVELLEEMRGSMILAAATEYNSDGQHEKLASFSKGKMNFQTGKTKLDRHGNLILTRGSNLAGLAHDYTITTPGKKNYAYGAGNVRMIMSGTSMAAPIATGAACLIKSAHPRLSSKDVLDYILRSARTKSFQGNLDLPVGKYGRGILDVNQALTMIKKDS